MKLPYFSAWDVTPVAVSLTQGIDDNGAPLVVATYTGNCNFSEKAKTIRSADGQNVRLNGSLTIRGDIAPALGVLEGRVEINGADWNIYNGTRFRNPDGTVNHTKLELV